MVPVHLTFLGMLLFVSKDYLVDAIRCHVCAPIPDFQVTCVDYKDGAPEDCGATTEFCHVLFRQHPGPKGKLEVFRNCGKYKGAFAAGDDECRDFATSDGGSAKLCNCMKDECNIQAINVPQDQSPTPETHGKPVTVGTLAPSRTQAALATSTAKSGAACQRLAFSSSLRIISLGGVVFFLGLLRSNNL